MKNSRRLLKNRRSGKLFSAKSSEALIYVDNFILQAPHVEKRMAVPLRAIVTVFHENHRHDLDCALVYDCLQKANVIGNDRQIIEKHEYLHIDSDNPRVEITIEEI